MLLASAGSFLVLSDQFSCFFRPAEHTALMNTVGFAHTAAFRGLGPEGQFTSQIGLQALVSTPPEYLLSCCTSACTCVSEHAARRSWRVNIVHIRGKWERAAYKHKF